MHKLAILAVFGSVVAKEMCFQRANPCSPAQISEEVAAVMIVAQDFLQKHAHDSSKTSKHLDVIKNIKKEIQEYQKNKNTHSLNLVAQHIHQLKHLVEADPSFSEKPIPITPSTSTTTSSTPELTQAFSQLESTFGKDIGLDLRIENVQYYVDALRFRYSMDTIYTPQIRKQILDTEKEISLLREELGGIDLDSVNFEADVKVIIRDMKSSRDFNDKLRRQEMPMTHGKDPEQIARDRRVENMLTERRRNMNLQRVEEEMRKEEEQKKNIQIHRGEEDVYTPVTSALTSTLNTEEEQLSSLEDIISIYEDLKRESGGNSQDALEKLKKRKDLDQIGASMSFYAKLLENERGDKISKENEEFFKTIKPIVTGLEGETLGEVFTRLKTISGMYNEKEKLNLMKKIEEVKSHMMKELKL